MVSAAGAPAAAAPGACHGTTVGASLMGGGRRRRPAGRAVDAWSELERMTGQETGRIIEGSGDPLARRIARDRRATGRETPSRTWPLVGLRSP